MIPDGLQYFSEHFWIDQNCDQNSTLGPRIYHQSISKTQETYGHILGNIIFHTPLETPILYVLPLEIVPMGRLSIQAEFLTPLWGGLPTILFAKSREKPICFTTILPYQKVLRI